MEEDNKSINCDAGCASARQLFQGLEDYERTTEELRFVKSVVQGLVDLREGNTVSLEDAKRSLGI